MATGIYHQKRKASYRNTSSSNAHYQVQTKHVQIPPPSTYCMHLKVGNSHGDSLAVRVGSTILALDDLNVLHSGTSTLAGNTQRLEDSLLGTPATSERALRARGLATVRDLVGSEVSLNKGVIINVNGRNVLNINADLAVLVGNLESKCLHDLLGLLGLGRRNDLLRSLHEVRAILELRRLLVLSDTGIRVQQNLAELVVSLVVDEAIVEVAVGLLLTGIDLGAVLSVGLLVESSKQVLGVNTNSLSTLLTETERGDGEGLDTISLDASAGVHNEVILLHDGINVIGVAVTRNKTSVEDLETSVHHPSTCSTLGVTGKVLLKDTQNSVTLLAAEVAKLLADNVGLVLVVGPGGGSVERSDTDIVNSKTPSGKGTTERSDTGIALPEVVAHAAEEFLLLASSLSLNVSEAVLSVLLLVESGTLGLHGVNLVMDVLKLRLLPLLDGLLAALNLATAVVDVKQRRRELARVLTSSSENTLSGSRNGAANLVRGGSSKSDDTVDGDTHVKGKLGSHDDLDTTTLGLHESVSGSGGRTRHLLGGTAMSKLVDSVASGFHVGKLVRAFLTEIVETTNETDASLTLHDSLVTSVDGLDSSSTSTDGGLDRSGRRHQQHVNPSGHGVDERLLENVVLYRLVEEASAVHVPESSSTTHAGTNTVTNLRNVDVLVELIRISDTARQKSFGSGNEEEQGNGVDLRDDVVGNTVSLGVPAGGDLSSNKAVKTKGLRDPERGTLPETDDVLAAVRDLKDLDLVTVLTLELLGGLLGRLKGLEVLLNDNLVEKLLPVGVIAIEQLRLDQTDTRVLENVLLVLLLNVLVVNRLSCLGINPARVGLALDRTVVVLDETHDPSHLDATLKREFAVGFHLPSGTRVTPGTNLGETSNNNNLLKIDHALEVVVEGLNLSLPVRALREVKLDVGARVDGLLLVENLRGSTIDNGVLNGALLSNSTTDLAGLHDILAKLGHGLVQVRDELETTVEISKDRLVLAQVNQSGGHKTEKVESHLLLRESADAESLNAFSNNVVARHETSSSGPANDSTADGEVVGPALGVPSVEESLKTELGLGVETIVTKGTVVGRKRQDDLSRSGLEATLSLLGLDTSEKTNKVGKHDAVSELRLGVNVVNLTAVLGNGSERNNEVEIPAETLLGVVDILDQSLNILLATLIEGNNNNLRATRTVAGVHSLVVLRDLTGEAAGGNDDLGTTADKTLKDLSTNRTRTGTSHENVLVLECDTRLSSILQAVQIHASKLLAVVPAVETLLLEVKEGNGLNLALTLAVLKNLSSLVVLGKNLALVHGKRSEDITIQALDLKLRSLGQLVLLLDKFVDAGKIALNLGTVTVLRDLTTLGHLLNIVF
ncbi:unnamed protein product [Fusarium venenatum]|uniref:Uncharacterized protein n=1 Tax=Fusarium venenatum TaxID=56646 RepID=A0A2L2TTK4_9HYPO|nr:uncharacterized protein FVRRES_08934 [Fusarium venenatum]CEI68857.1 unnamed protein product [Fusarium venenatum]